MEYRYKAVKNTGEIIEGVFSGNSKEDVAQMLRNNQSYPTYIER